MNRYFTFNSYSFRMLTIALSALFLANTGCSSSDDDEPTPEQPQTVDNNTTKPVSTPTTNWSVIANKSTNAFLQYYWDNERHFFNKFPNKKDPDGDWNYWPQAHAMDVVIDAYLRTKDRDSYYSLFGLWYEGIKQKSGGQYLNNMVDDMEWICLTMLRLYEATNEKQYLETAELLWNDIKSTWNNNEGGGLCWQKNDPYGKNACSNGPGGIIACRMYRLNGQKTADLDMAKKIYEWETTTLVNINTGEVKDNIKNGNVQDWVFTYNQGTYLGLAHELYKLTGDESYLNMAIKAADYTMKYLTNDDGILKDEGQGDGGLFKAVFVRYFAILADEQAVPESDHSRYVFFLRNNVTTLKDKGTNPDNFYSSMWWEPGNTDTEVTTQTSGCTMIEAWATYIKNHPDEE